MAFSRWLVLSGTRRGGDPGGRDQPQMPSGGGEAAVPSWAHVAPEQIAEARKYGVPVAFENSIGMRFVLIPAGTFLMGSPEAEVGGGDREAQRQVVLTKPFYMQVTEVTNAQYLRCVPSHPTRSLYNCGLAPERLPASWITWYAATEFAAWLREREPSRLYALPTEAQWEYACRAGSRGRFWWGDSEAEAGKYENAGTHRGRTQPLALSSRRTTAARGSRPWGHTGPILGALRHAGERQQLVRGLVGRRGLRAGVALAPAEADEALVPVGICARGCGESARTQTGMAARRAWGVLSLGTRQGALCVERLQ